MKKIAACLAVVLALAGVYFYCMSATAPSQSNYDYLRIHVRANSNAQNDQDVKYIVKDEVVKFITPYIGKRYARNRRLAGRNYRGLRKNFGGERVSLRSPRTNL